MKIVPIMPETEDLADNGQAAGQSLIRKPEQSRRTFGLLHPSRRTFGGYHPSRRTFGGRFPSRRTFGIFHP